MRKSFYLLAPIIFFSCSRNTTDDTKVSKRYFHKYGFEIAQDEWEKRQQEGQVLTIDENGVTTTQSFEHGILNGPTTYSYPNSGVTQKKETYDNGTLLKEIIYDPSGVPIRESDYEFEEQVIQTCWNDKGVPISIEHYQGENLIEGKYYNSDHILEASIIDGTGTKIKRDRKGVILQQETLENGKICSRTCYYADGIVQSETHYIDNQPHGLQKSLQRLGSP